MSELQALEAQLQEAREKFLEAVEDVRPALHKYCGRMTGSVLDGEDVVQETLAQAYYKLFGPFGTGTKERSENGLTVTKLSRLASSLRR